MLQALAFNYVTSLAYHQGLFYWSSGLQQQQAVFYEEYNPKENRYYHTQIPLEQQHFTGLHVWHPLSQPLPVPLLPPRHLQALLSKHTATLQWQAPNLNQGQSSLSASTTNLNASFLLSEL